MVLRNAFTAIVSFAYGGFTLFALASQLSSATNSSPLYTRPTTPDEHSFPKNFGDQCSSGLDCSLFARTTKGISLISLPVGTKIFQFPTFALFRVILMDQVSPFGHPRVKAYLAAHRGLSQPYHVLHRLPMPRHPPCTLNSLKISKIFELQGHFASINFFGN